MDARKLSLRAIAAGWGFQLNADATGNFVNEVWTLLSFGSILFRVRTIFYACPSLRRGARHGHRGGSSD
jgi:hypothetical protein